MAAFNVVMTVPPLIDAAAQQQPAAGGQRGEEELAARESIRRQALLATRVEVRHLLTHLALRLTPIRRRSCTGCGGGGVTNYPRRRPITAAACDEKLKCDCSISSHARGPGTSY